MILALLVRLDPKALKVSKASKVKRVKRETQAKLVLLALKDPKANRGR